MQIIATSFAGRPTFVMLQVSVVVSRQVGCLFLLCLYNKNSFFGKILERLPREAVADGPDDELVRTHWYPISNCYNFEMQTHIFWRFYLMPCQRLSQIHNAVYFMYLYTVVKGPLKSQRLSLSVTIMWNGRMMDKEWCCSVAWTMPSTTLNGAAISEWLS